MQGSNPQSTYRGRDEIGGVSAHSAGAYTATLYVRDGKYSKKGVDVHPPPSPTWANISIMMECTPESGRRHSVCTL